MEQTTEWLSEVPNNPFQVARTWKIAASAGCGKTFTIERTIRELLDQGVKPESIMYVLFNALPAAQFRARFPQLDRDQKKWWGTHHSICIRQNKRQKIMDSAADWRDFGTPFRYDFKGNKDDEDMSGDALRSLYEKALFDDSLHLLDPKTLLFKERLEGYQLANNTTDFSRTVYDSVKRDQFPDDIEYVFVDEAQDNGRIQHEYWQRVLNSTPIKGFMLVGDDKQAINGFKGGNAEGFLNFQCEKQVSLPMSFRCAPSILRAANSIAEPIQKRSPLISTSALESPGHVFSSPSLKNLLRMIKEEVVEGKDVILLARTGQILGIAKSILSDAGIPYKDHDIEVIRRIYQAFNNMRRTGVITEADRLLLDPYSDSDLKMGLRKKCPYYSQEWRKERLQLKKNKSLLSSSQLSILSSFEKEDVDTPLADAERIGFTDAFIADVLSGAPKPEYFLGSKELPELVEYWIKSFGPDFRCVHAETIHTMKGSEADTVILVSDISGLMHRREALQLDDERRVWYVAATRAKTKLVITRVGNRETTRLLRHIS